MLGGSIKSNRGDTHSCIITISQPSHPTLKSSSHNHIRNIYHIIHDSAASQILKITSRGTNNESPWHRYTENYMSECLNLRQLECIVFVGLTLFMINCFALMQVLIIHKRSHVAINMYSSHAYGGMSQHMCSGMLTRCCNYYNG